MNELKLNSPWVLLSINDVVYAVSSSVVLSLNQLSQITPLPVSPKEVRGVIDFRSHSIQLVDSRKMLGMKSVDEEIDSFRETMEQRYNDHMNWVNTLEETVKNGQEFTLTTDPHKCAFGKWYDNYSTKNTNIMFLSTFAKFDKPHKAIHEIGVITQQLIKRGKKEEAIELINEVKNNELKQMLQLFNDIKTAYKDGRKEIMVVIGEEGNCIGLSVDQIVAIEHLSDIDEDLIKESITNVEYLSGLGKRKDDSVVFLLNDEYILNKFH